MDFLYEGLSPAAVDGNIEKRKAGPEDDQEGEEESRPGVGGAEQAVAVEVLGDESPVGNPPFY